MRLTRNHVYIAAAAGIIAAGMSLFAPAASATTVNVSVASTCTSSGDWVVTATAHNTYTTPLDAQFGNSVEVMGFHLNPGQTLSGHITVFDSTFRYQWTTSNAILVGNLSGTLHRPDGCSLPPTTVPGTTSTTTCDRAIPPRGDCAGVTTTTVPSSSPPTSLEPFPSTSVVTAPPSSVPASNVPAAPTTTHPTIAALPHTGAGDWLLLIAAIGIFAVLVGMALISAKQLDRWKKGER